MDRNRAVEEAALIMSSFAERTGLTGAEPPRRYLWTDAFAVCNFLALERATNQDRYGTLALGLVEQVHQVLGRYRDDDRRRGWLSGLSGAEAEAHPTRGGLRIGKPLPERQPDEPLDDQLEWDRDGQYFHYLTKWMHALDQMAGWTGDARFSVWARELAETAYRAFTYQTPSTSHRRMVWKMSTDLSRPLVQSAGQHDPLDGYVTYLQLAATARRLRPASGPDLGPAVADFATMLQGQDLLTIDPLGLGTLLTDAGRVAQLVTDGAPVPPELVGDLLEGALTGLPLYLRRGELQQPPSLRLGFRELGLAIGLRAIEIMEADPERGNYPAALSTETRARIEAAASYLPLGTAIRSFWLAGGRRTSNEWAEHRDINDVMLATSLTPEGFLVLRRPA